MTDEIKYEKLTYDNLDIATKIQNEIFPEEDGRTNYLEAIEKDSYRKEMEYYIAYVNDKPVGVTGLYVYHEYPTDAWLGRFGVLEKYRNHGYGGKILDKTISLAKDKGYKNFRLYTDEYAKDAHKLYSSRGLIKELYDNPDDKDLYIEADIYIYSKSLTDSPVSLWNNKNIGIKEQSEKEH